MDLIVDKPIVDTQVDSIKRLLKERNAILLAHYYQAPEIQSIADFTGDSLALSQKAANTNADVILFCGVRFMAETAKILNPSRRVILPDLNAGCTLVDACPPESFKSFVQAHPDHIVVTYINSSVEVKAMSDIICTSSNAEKIIRSIPEDQPILFAPDKNLGQFLNKQCNRNMLLWDGYCEVHRRFSMLKLSLLREQYPDALLIAHPESNPELLEQADFIGSTTKLIRFAQENPATTFLIGTEAGILHEMQQRIHGKKLIPLPVAENNACACSECEYMKLSTLDKIESALRNMKPEIHIEETLRLQALRPLEKMFEICA